MRTRKYANALEIFLIDFDLVPNRVFGQFAPHVSAPPIQQRTANGVLCFVGQVRIENHAFELFAILVILFLVKLVLQKFGKNFRFSDATLENHATSFHRRRAMERKNGSETMSSIRTLSHICTTITCRKSE